MQNGSWLTFADRRKGGLANWDAPSPHSAWPKGRAVVTSKSGAEGSIGR